MGGLAFFTLGLTAAQREAESCDVRRQRSRSQGATVSHPFVETGVWRIKGSKVRDKNQSRFSRNVSTLKAPLRAWALTRKNVGGAWRGRRGRKQLFARNTESSPWFSGAAGEFMRMTECERTTASKAANQCWENAGSSSSRPHPTPMWSHGPGTLVMRSAGEALEPPEQTRTKQPAGFSHQPGRTENPAGPRPFRTGVL